jgi:hypothetical protein
VDCLHTVTVAAGEEGFGVRLDRMGVTRAHQCQLLNGLITNATSAVPPGEDDTLRALLHNCVPP